MGAAGGFEQAKWATISVLGWFGCSSPKESDAFAREGEMKSERRGLVLIFTVLLLSAALGGIYGPNVRVAANSDEDARISVRDFTRVLDAVEANYAEKVDVDRIVYEG